MFGIIVTLAALKPLGDRRRLNTVLSVGAGVALTLPVLAVLQQTIGSGYLPQRIQALHFSGGLARTLDRSGVWTYFADRFPHGKALYFGSGPAFDYERYQTYPHNLALTLIFTVGLLGAITFYGLLFAIVVRCYRSWRTSKSAYAFLAGLLVALFVVNEVKIEYLRPQLSVVRLGAARRLRRGAVCDRHSGGGNG